MAKFYTEQQEEDALYNDWVRGSSKAENEKILMCE